MLNQDQLEISGRMPAEAGFTLIELLIVVAIIAILAAIAVPNMLEAQTRSKVSRAASDLRTIAGALEAYRLDNNKYPLTGPDDQLTNQSRITSPIPYLTSILFDPFRDKRRDPGFGTSTFYIYHNRLPNGGTSDLPYCQRILTAGAKWHLYSVGPDGDHRNGFPNDSTVQEYLRYDPTNGTVSRGNICRWGPGNNLGGY